MEIRVRGRGRRAKRRGPVDGVAPSNWERSTASTRSVGSGRRRRPAGRRSRPGGPGRVVPKGGGSDASLGGGWVAGGDPEAGVGRRAATRKQGVGGIGGAETISLRRLVWRLSRFGGFYGSRHYTLRGQRLRPTRPADSFFAFSGISGFCTLLERCTVFF